MKIEQVCWYVEDVINDTIDFVEGFVFNTPPTCAQLCTQLPGVFSIETGINGESILCGAKIDEQPMTISFNNGAYTSTPQPFTPVHILGPHPTVVVTLKPCPRK